MAVGLAGGTAPRCCRARPAGVLESKSRCNGSSAGRGVPMLRLWQAPDESLDWGDGIMTCLSRSLVSGHCQLVTWGNYGFTT